MDTKKEPKGENQESQEKEITQAVEKTDLVTANSTAIIKSDEDELAGLSDLPNLEVAKAVPVDIMEGYWTPEQIGESKRMFFDKVAMRDCLDSETQEVKKLLCAYFFERQEDGSHKTICNGSARLVGVFETGKFNRLTPFEIKYLGEKKNSTNQFKSHDWSVKPLVINV